MELAFSPKTTTYLKEVFHEIRHQEETAEIIVPDSLPDVAGICCCHASVHLRDKECRNGSAAVSGAVTAGAFYTPEDGSHARLLEFYIPFTVRFDHAAITDGSQMTAELKICSVDTRMINSRKIMLRANVGCQITIYNPETYTHYELQRSDERLQLKQKTIEVCLPVEIAEKTFAAGDSFELPTSRPPVQQVCKVQCSCDVMDRKLVGNKAIFKGTLRCKLLYRSEDNGLYTWSHQLPFSQYCELQNDYDEDMLTVLPVIAGCDVSTETADKMSTLHLTVHILAQCIISTSRELELIEDAYCVRGILQPEWSQQTLPCCLDRKQEQLSLRHSLTGDLREIIDADVYPGFPSCRWDEQGTDVSVPVLVKLCGLDTEGKLTGMQGRNDLSVRYAMDENAICSMNVSSVDDCMVQITANGADVQFSVPTQVTFSAMQELSTICSATVEEMKPSESRKPSIILRSITQEEPLWDIAKAFGTTVDALQKSNGIDGDYTPDRGMLLIPAE